jgi:Large polyvalent protein associated domain 29
METLIISAEQSVELISSILQEEYPNAVFAVRLEDPVLSKMDMRGVDVIWVDGPDRDQVEETLDRFQGINWDPRTGELDRRSHYVVTSEGVLRRVFYNIDYIFCDGPIPAIHI